MEQPDTTEKVIRFGCGFTFGLFFSFLCMQVWLVIEGYWLLSFVLLVAIICGVLAIRKGDNFWYKIKDNYWWW